MVQLGEVWCNLVHSVQHVADCWNLVQVDAVCCNFEPFGTIWNSLVEIGAIWFSLVQPGAILRNLLEIGWTWRSFVKLGTVWCNLVPTGATWWSLLQLSNVNRTAAPRFLDNFVAYCSFYVYRNRSLHGRRFPRRIWAWSSYWAYKIALKDNWVRKWSFQQTMRCWKISDQGGYDRVKEKIKSVRQDFCAAVNKGGRKFGAVVWNMGWLPRYHVLVLWNWCRFIRDKQKLRNGCWKAWRYLFQPCFIALFKLRRT